MLLAQIVIVINFGITLLLYAKDHGKPKTGTDSFWVAATAVAIQSTLIYFAGGFSCFHIH